MNKKRIDMSLLTKQISLSYLLLSLIFLWPMQGHCLLANKQFESAEHAFAGNKVNLRYSNQIVIKGSDFAYKLQNGAILSYGDLVMMPDYYANSLAPISSSQDPKEREKRFQNAFTMLHQDLQFKKLFAILNNEKTAVADARKQGKNLTEFYKKYRFIENIDLYFATNGRYLKLAVTLFDHFGEDAITAYNTGHGLAIQDAIRAYNIKNDISTNDIVVKNALASCHTIPNQTKNCLKQQAITLLEEAYAKNAFSCHFLSDRFAAGHIRTPLRKLHDDKRIHVLGSAAAGLMHNEDNAVGVIVTNQTVQKWISHGDAYYYSELNAVNKQNLGQMMQRSADQIYQTFLTGIDPDPNAKILRAYMPVALPSQAAFGKQLQSQPLFIRKDDGIYRRANICNSYDFTAPIKDWTALATIISYLTKCSNEIGKPAILIPISGNVNSFMQELKIHLANAQQDLVSTMVNLTGKGLVLVDYQAVKGKFAAPPPPVFPNCYAALIIGESTGDGVSLLLKYYATIMGTNLELDPDQGLQIDFDYSSHKSDNSFSWGKINYKLDNLESERWLSIMIIGNDHEVFNEQTQC